MMLMETFFRFISLEDSKCIILIKIRFDLSIKVKVPKEYIENWSSADYKENWI